MSTKKILASITPDKAITMLKEGNLRFRKHQHIDRDFMNEVAVTAAKQYPFAIILGCIDSRVPVEILFDQGVGDLFVTRIAGNFENNDIIASMEYACEIVGSKLILVLGHESCGAVKAACDDVKMGHITELVSRIKPAITNTNIQGKISSKNKTCVDDVAKTNVLLTIDRIRKKSKILKTLEEKGKIKIAGGFYYVHSGEVKMVDDV